jgi:hypothetical protein
MFSEPSLYLPDITTSVDNDIQNPVVFPEIKAMHIQIEGNEACPNINSILPQCTGHFCHFMFVLGDHSAESNLCFCTLPCYNAEQSMRIRYEYSGQDCTPAKITENSVPALKAVFSEWMICRELWPSCSLDLNACDFYRW